MHNRSLHLLHSHIESLYIKRGVPEESKGAANSLGSPLDQAIPAMMTMVTQRAA